MVKHAPPSGRLLAVITRAREIRLRGFDRAGERIDLRLRDFPARVVQHECDHLDGTLFVDRVTDRAALHWIDPDEAVEDGGGGTRRRKQGSGDAAPASIQ